MNASTTAPAAPGQPAATGLRFAITLVGALGLVAFAAYGYATGPSPRVDLLLSGVAFGLGALAHLFGRRWGSAPLLNASYAVSGIAIGLLLGRLVG